ncbi:lyase family protein [Leucobacter soli]|uniref:lyase family protein n=2 Tax=Leucobacter soli TaxID=2812850 RepID=UPI00360882B4
MIDTGLLSPVTVGHDHAVSDAVFAIALIRAELALTQAWAELDIAPEAAAIGFEQTFGVDAAGALGAGFERLDLAELVERSVAGGNPVIPLVGMLRAGVPEGAREWVHRGATSQDILDTALMLFARDAGFEVLAHLVEIDEALTAFAAEHRDQTAAARTLTQHAVPTTLGLRAANWAQGVDRAALKLDEALAQLPVQLAGAGGTLASFVQISGAASAEALPDVYAEILGLAIPDGAWHTVRWPVTELGEALAQAIGALGRIAADVATLSRTEIGELAEGSGGGSSAMPQKRNPVGSVLIRSAAIRAPHLAATLHAAAGLFVDERPDGAWHAEWQTLRELLRLALGAAGNAAELVSGLRVDSDAVERNLALTGGLIVAERISLVLGPIIGAERVAEIVAAAGRGPTSRRCCAPSRGSKARASTSPTCSTPPATRAWPAYSSTASPTPARQMSNSSSCAQSQDPL